MTVCVACLSDNGKKVVAGTDNTITHTIGTNVTYELETPHNKKLISIKENFSVMGAGNPDNINVVIANAKKKIHPQDQPKVATEKVRDAFVEFWRDSQEKSILSPVGLNWNIWTTQQNKLDSAIAKDIYEKLQKHQPIGELVSVGYDTNTKEAYIAVISNGIILDRNTLGMGFAGAGMPLANFSLIKAGYKKDMEDSEVRRLVEEAIKDASHTAGVGGMGDIVILPV
jgi:hypothetical protein